MKHFVYTYSERTPRSGACEYTAKVYRIVRNMPVLLGKKTDTYTSKDQLVLEVLKEHKALPKKTFERHGMLWHLAYANIATVTEL